MKTTLASFATLAAMFASISPARAQISSCTYGESFEFNNNASIIFTPNSSNNRLFEAQTIHNETTFDFSVLDSNSPNNRRLMTPISGDNHNQDGGTATDGGIQLLAAVGNTTADVDVTVNISGGFVTEIEFYGHDIEDDEVASFGTADYVTGTLMPHPGATVGTNAATGVATGTAPNSDGSSNRSAFAVYQNNNGVSTLTMNFGVVNGRIGGGFALGTYCVSRIEAEIESFTSITRTGGTTSSILASDTLNGVILDPAGVTLTLGDITGPDGNPSTDITVKPNNTITVPPDTEDGDYTVEYEVCDIVNPTNCSSATETVTVLPPDVSLGAVKTVSMFGTAGAASYAIPGNDVIYSISVTNSGADSADDDSMEIIDNMPPEISFWNGDIDFGGPDNFTDTTPVALEQSTGAGLTFDYNTDVRFGFGATAPADFDSCAALAPDNTYRDDVTFICLNPKGALNGGAPAPTFSVNFRARIN